MRDTFLGILVGKDWPPPAKIDDTRNLIGRLPDEVLAFVFLAGREIPEHGSDSSSWKRPLYEIRVGSVSKTWRAVSRGCRRLWSPVLIPDGRGDAEVCLNMVEEILGLSGSLPLEIFVQVSRTTQKYVVLLRQHLHRVFALSVELRDEQGMSTLFPLLNVPNLRMLAVQGFIWNRTPLVITEEASVIEALRYEMGGMPLDVTSVPTTALRSLTITGYNIPEQLDETLVHLVSRCALEQLHLRQMSWPFSCFDLKASPALTHLSLRFDDLRPRNSVQDACLFDSASSLRHLYLDLGHGEFSAHLHPQKWPSLPLLRPLKIARGAHSSMAILRQCPNVVALELEHDADEILGWLGDVPEWRKGAPHTELRLIRMTSRSRNPTVLTPGLYARLLERRPSIRIEEHTSGGDASWLDSISTGVHHIIAEEKQTGYRRGSIPLTPLLC